MMVTYGPKRKKQANAERLGTYLRYLVIAGQPQPAFSWSSRKLLFPVPPTDVDPATCNFDSHNDPRLD